MNKIGDDIHQAYEDGFADGEWEMFERISNVIYGKQCYFLEDTGIVYSRITCKNLPSKEDAYEEFIDYCDRW